MDELWIFLGEITLTI